MNAPIVLVLAVLIPVGILAVVRVAARRRLVPLMQLLDGQNGEIRGILGLRLVGHRSGQEVTFVAEPASRHSPAKLHIRLHCGAPGAFRVTREGPGTRFAKALHLMKDVQVGDPELDAQYVFSADASGRFPLWIQESGVREAIVALMSRKGGAVLALRNGVLAATQVRPHAEDYRLESVGPALAQLEQLGASLLGRG